MSAEKVRRGGTPSERSTHHCFSQLSAHTRPAPQQGAKIFKTKVRAARLTRMRARRGVRARPPRVPAPYLRAAAARRTCASRSQSRCRAPEAFRAAPASARAPVRCGAGAGASVALTSLAPTPVPPSRAPALPRERGLAVRPVPRCRGRRRPQAGPEPARPLRPPVGPGRGLRLLRGEQGQRHRVGRGHALRLPARPGQVHQGKCASARRWRRGAGAERNGARRAARRASRRTPCAAAAVECRAPRRWARRCPSRADKPCIAETCSCGAILLTDVARHRQRTCARARVACCARTREAGGSNFLACALGGPRTTSNIF